MSLYEVGIGITMTNGVSSVLNLIQRQVLGLHNTVNMTTGSMNRLKLAVGGAFAVAGGLALLGVMGKLVKSGEEYNRQLVLMKRAGFTPDEISASRTAANSASDLVKQIAPAENLAMIRELRGVLGSTEHAMQALPEFAKASAMLEQVLGRHDPRAMSQLAKALELQGGIYDAHHNISPTAFRGAMNEMMSTLVAAGGQITPQDLLGLMKQAGPMARMMSPAMLQDTIMTAVMEMGGQRAGTALSAVGRAMYGGIMPERNALEFSKLGLLSPGGYDVKRGGHIVVHPGGFQGMDVLNNQGMLSWVQTILKPALESRGFRSPEQQQQELYRLFPTETARRLIGLFLQQAQTVERDMGLRRLAGGGESFSDGRRDRDAYGSADGKDAYSRMLDESLGMATKGFHEQLSRIMTDLGTAITPAVVTMLNGFSSAMAVLARVIEAHPTATKALMLTLAGLAVALTVVGGIAVGAASLAALAAAGLGAGTVAVIAGIAAAIPAFVYAIMRFGPAVAGWLAQARDALTGAAKGIAERLRNVWIALVQGLLDLGNKAKEAFMGLVDKIAEAIHALVDRLTSFISSSGLGKAFGPNAPPSNDLGLPGIQPQSFHGVIPPAANTNIHNISVQLDGRDIAHHVTTSVARRMNAAPPSGSTGADRTISPFAGSLAI